MPQVERVDYALDLAQPRSKTIDRGSARTPETHGILPVSLLLKARRRAADPRIAALAETYPSMSDGSGNRRAAVLHNSRAALREAGSEGTRP